MSKKLKTTTNKKNILIKAIIFAIAFLIVTSVIVFTSNIAQDRTLFANATLGDTKKEELDEKVVEEATEVSDKETEIIKINKDKTPTIVDTIYCVVSGDSYSRICKMFYDNEDLCWALMEYNGANSNTMLHVGQELKIPDIDNEEFTKLIKNVTKPQPKNVTKTVEAQPVMTNVASSKPAEEKKESEQKSTPATNVNYSAPTVSGNVRNNPGYVDTSGFTYLGSYRITGYTPGCAHCCGNTKGITASGVPAVIGRTIAAKGFSFGQTLYIKGYGFYVVEDRGGFAAGTIDMAAGSHEACYSITSSGVDVYLVPNN